MKSFVVKSPPPFNDLPLDQLHIITGLRLGKPNSPITPDPNNHEKSGVRLQISLILETTVI